MPDREADDAERGPAAGGLGTTGGAGAHPAVQPGAGHAGQPGGGHAAGQPGGGHAAQPTAQPAQPSAGHTAQPAGQTGTGYAGGPLSISTKGLLIAAAAVVAVVIAALAAFLLLRPDPPQQTATRQAPTTATNPAPGATPDAATPDAAAPAGPWLRGTYRVAARSGWPEHDVTATSDCPACDATVTSAGGTLVVHSAGDGWTIPDQYCGEISFTPTVVVNGIVQELLVSACAASAAHTMTRIGD